MNMCRHEHVASVALVTGELVKKLCEDCLAELPPSWGCEDCEYVEVATLSSTETSRVMGMPCPRHRRQL